MKKILTFIDGLNSGGAQRQIVGLSALLVDRGYDVKFLWYHPTDFYRYYLEEHNVPYKQLLPKGKMNKLVSIIKQVLKEKPDVIIAYIDGPTMMSCLLKAFGLKSTIIVSERNTTQIINRHTRIKFWLYRFADFIVPNSYTQTTFIKQNFPTLKRKLVTITNFVDTDYFKPTSVKNKNEIFKIVCAGRLFEQKNILKFLDAVALLKEKGLKFEIHWFGNKDRKSDYEERCRLKMQSLNLTDVFRFEDSTNNILSVYQTADLFCLPSIYEGFPNVVCEAMSCGLPIAASDVCDNSKIIREGENGYLFNPISEVSISETIEKMIRMESDRIERMGKRSRELAIDMFAKTKFVEKYENLFI